MHGKGFLVGLLLVFLVSCPSPIYGVSSERYETFQEEALITPIVSPEDLTDHLYDINLIILDVRELEEYINGHIPGAVPVDVGSLLPYINHLPSRNELERLLRRYGIEPGKRVVIYDDRDGLYASLLFFLLTYGGYKRVSILDGGILRWKEEGWPLEWGVRPIKESSFEIRFREDLIGNKRWLQNNRGNKDLIILDTRPPLYRSTHRWDNSGLKVIHIPWRKNLDPFNGGFRDIEDLRDLYTTRGVTEDKRIVIYGRNLLEATVTYLALKAAGYKGLYIYIPSGK